MEAKLATGEYQVIAGQSPRDRDAECWAGRREPEGERLKNLKKIIDNPRVHLRKTVIHSA